MKKDDEEDELETRSSFTSTEYTRARLPKKYILNDTK